MSALPACVTSYQRSKSGRYRPLVWLNTGGNWTNKREASAKSGGTFGFAKRFSKFGYHAFAFPRVFFGALPRRGSLLDFGRRISAHERARLPFRREQDD